MIRQDAMLRGTRAQQPPPFREATLFKVTASTQIGVTNRWVYTVQKAVVGSTTSYIPQVDEAINEEAVSVSELSNGTYLAYGVTAANIPSGFSVVKIPNGTYVECVPHRRSDGSFVWLIVNTQAIDGTCQSDPLADILGSDHIDYTEPTISWRFRPQHRVWLTTDCTTADDYLTNVSGTGAAVTFNDAGIHESGHVGLAKCASGTTTTGRAFLCTPTQDCIQLGNGAVVLEMAVKTPSSLSDATNRYNVIAGLHDNFASAVNAVDGVYFIYRDNLNSGKWQCVTYQNASTTAVDSGITVAASTWYCLRIEINAAGTEAKFYIDGALVVTETTNIPTTATYQTGVAVGIRKGAGTTDRFALVDYIDYSQDISRCPAS